MNEKRPQYLQIYDYIIERIENGEYTEQLPKISELAKQMSVSKATVSHAYRILKSEGYIKVFAGKAYIEKDERERCYKWE